MVIAKNYIMEPWHFARAFYIIQYLRADLGTQYSKRPSMGHPV
jgi:hypothetical protein